jgi:hypothetical protein
MRYQQDIRVIPFQAQKASAVLYDYRSYPGAQDFFKRSPSDRAEADFKFNEQNHPDIIKICEFPAENSVPLRGIPSKE